MKRYGIIVLLLWLLLAMLWHPADAMAAMRGGWELCMNTVVPSLFPFLVFNDLLIHSGFVHIMNRILNRFLQPVFHVSAHGLSAVLLGMIGGYPLGAKSAVSLLEEGSISTKEFSRILAFCNNAGPLFVIGTVGVGMFRSSGCGYILLLSHILASGIVGLLFRNYQKEQKERRLFTAKAISKKSFCLLFTDSISHAVSSILQICGYILFFQVLIRLFYTVGILPFLAHTLSSLFLVEAEIPAAVLSGFLEMTSGISMIASYTPLPLQLRLSITSLLLGFGGLCIHAQTIGILGKHPKKTYLAGKALQAMFSMGITFFLCYIWPL